MQLRAPSRAVLALLAGAALGSVSFPAAAAPREQAIWHTREVVQNNLFGAPSFIQGEFRVKASASDPVAVARTFLNAQKTMTGIAQPDSELRVLSVYGPDEVGMTHVKFAHQAKGLPVFGSELIVGMKGNLVTSMNGVFLRSVNLPVDVRVQGDDASLLAMDNLRDLLQQGLVNGDIGQRWFGLELDRNPELGFFNQGLITEQRTDTELALSLIHI